MWQDCKCSEYGSTNQNTWMTPNHVFLFSFVSKKSPALSRQWNALVRSRSQQPDRLGPPPIPTCWSRTPPDEHDATLTAATTEMTTATVPAPAAPRRTATGMETRYRWCRRGTRGCHIRMLRTNPSELHCLKRKSQMVRFQELGKEIYVCSPFVLISDRILVVFLFLQSMGWSWAVRSSSSTWQTQAWLQRKERCRRVTSYSRWKLRFGWLI